MGKLNLFQDEGKWTNLQFYLIQGLFLLGILLPTSVAVWMKLEVVYLAVSFLLLFLIFLTGKKNKWFILSGIILNLLLWIFTYLSPLRFSKGEMIYYVALFATVTLLFQVKINKPNERQKNQFFKIQSVIFQVVSWVLLFLGYSIVTRFSPVTNILINRYNYFYDGLVESMIFQEKPVVIFGSHSVAGFYLFLFLVLNYLLFMKTRDILSGAAFIGFLGLLFYLKSTSGYLYFLVGILLLLFFLYKENKLIFGISAVVLVLGGGYYLYQSSIFEKIWRTFTTSSSGNGFGSRYLKGGTVYPQIQRVLSSPFVGSGTRSIDGTFYIDSGPVHLAQRVGIEGMLIFYGLFLGFLKRHFNWKLALGIFIFFFAFEIGLANLLYFRTIFMLLFFVQFVQRLQSTNLANEKEKN